MTIEPTEVVTWVKVERPVFDLFGILVSSLTFATLAVVVAMCLGGVFGLFLIRRNRAYAEQPLAALHLGNSSG